MPKWNICPANIRFQCQIYQLNFLISSFYLQKISNPPDTVIRDAGLVLLYQLLLLLLLLLLYYQYGESTVVRDVAIPFIRKGKNVWTYSMLNTFAA